MKTKLGRYEFYCLWKAVNSGGRISMNDLKESISGHTSANSRVMPIPLYHKVERLNKAIIRASRSLHRKGLIILEESLGSAYSNRKKPVALLLTNRGLEAAQRYVFPRQNPEPNQVPYIAVITDATPSTIFTYDTTGQLEEAHEVEPMTREEYLGTYSTEPLDAT